jgi:Caspase domain
MTQLFFDAQKQGPGLHALVVSVGGYAHLQDGTGTVIEDPLAYGNLGQLTSPPRSALAFAKWLQESKHDRWKAPLATMDLLISPAPGDPEPGGPGVTFKQATIDGIQTAFDDWKDRCGGDADNVAVFYFCGHGLQSEEQILLASDFGRYASNHFRGAFAFDSTRDGFLQSLPKTQCFFIDACREVTPGVVEILGGATAEPLMKPQAYKPRRCEHDLTLQSSAPFESAFAPTGEVSYFTTALLDAFKGGSALTNEYGDWVVRTDGISSCIDELLQTASGRRQPTAKGPALAPTVLYRLDGVPDVQLILECDPRVALEKATLSYEPIPPPVGKRVERTPPASKVWDLTVKAGFYTVGATFADATFADVMQPVLVTPPSFPHKLRVVAAV